MFGGSFRASRLAGGVLAAVIATAPQIASAQTLSLNIPAQPLASALNAFAKQAGIQIFFPTDQISGLRSPAIKGALPAKVALAKLIAKTDLEIVSDDGKTIVLKRGKAPLEPTANAEAAADAASRAEEIIVKGTPRAGTLKRDSATVVSTITEIETKRLPNLDVSDVLLRLPGIRRNDTQSGENRYVSVRGLNNAATSQSIDGVLLTNYINGSRANSTELLTSNFLRNVVVATTVTPDLDENANGAHVSLTTISGLDSNGDHLLDVRAFGGINSRSGGVHDTQQPIRASATWRGALDQDHKWGLAIGGDYDQLGSRQDAESVAGYSTVNGNLVPNGALTKGQTFTRSRRISAMARLDFRPTDKLSFFAEYFYMSHRFITDQRVATVTVSAANATNVTANSGQFNSGSATYGFNHNESPLIRDHIFEGGADYVISDKDKVSARFGATFNRVRSFGITTSGFSAANSTLTSPVGYSFSGDTLYFTPGSSTALANAANYNLTGKVTVNDVVSKDQNYFARVDYAHNFEAHDHGLGIKIGSQLKTLDRDNVQYGYARVLATGQAINLSEVTGSSSVSLFSPVDWNQSTFLSLVNQRGIPSPDANRLYAADPADGYGQNFSGTEQIVDLYGIASYGFGRARVSAGVRAAYTHRTLNEYEPNAIGVWGLAHYDQSYWDILPSSYGYYDLTNHLKLRAAFSKSLERPAINSASRRLVTSYDTPITRTISYSNPYLLPIRSTNFDASAEYYYGPHDAYFSVGVFSKYLRDIPAVSSSQTIGADGVREITSYTSNVTEVNGKKVYGRLRGLEVVWSDPQLKFFPARFGNLGFMLSYDYIVYQSTAINGGGGVPPTDTRLVDAAQRNYYNAALYYNYGPFAANVFVQKQSSIPSLSYNPINDRRTDYAPLVDLQASYAITKNVRVMIEGRNCSIRILSIAMA